MALEPAGCSLLLIAFVPSNDKIGAKEENERQLNCLEAILDGRAEKEWQLTSPSPCLRVGPQELGGFHNDYNFWVDILK